MMNEKSIYDVAINAMLNGFCLVRYRSNLGFEIVSPEEILEYIKSKKKYEMIKDIKKVIDRIYLYNNKYKEGQQ